MYEELIRTVYCNVQTTKDLILVGSMLLVYMYRLDIVERFFLGVATRDELPAINLVLLYAEALARGHV